LHTLGDRKTVTNGGTMKLLTLFFSLALRRSGRSSSATPASSSI